MKKLLQLSIITVLSIIVLAACGDDEKSNGEKEFTIGVTQIVEHDSLDEAYKGFQDAIKEAGLNVKYDFQSAQNEIPNVHTIAEGFVADDVDLIFANATPSAQGAENATDDIPVVFTSVTDAVEADLVESMEEPGANVTGVVDLHPEAIGKTIAFIEEYFPGARIGTIYNAGEQNSVVQIDAINEAIKGTSLSVVERTVATSADVQSAAQTLIEEVDLFYIFTDNVVVSALDSVVDVADNQQIPLVVGEPDSLANGGFMTYGISYYEIGYTAGEQAVEILKDGKKPADIPVGYPKEVVLLINKEAAELQGVEWDADWDEDAEFINE